MKLVAALCFILTAFTVLVEARYRFEVGILSFQNPSNTDSNGQNCDIGFDTVCEYTFRFCLSLPGNSNCVLGSTVTGSSYITGSPYTFTLGQPLIPGTTIPNPIVYTDAISTGNQWPIGIDFRIQIEDYDNLANDLIDRIIIQRNILPSDDLLDNIYTGTFSKVSMRVQIKVMCQDNFFRDDCFTECIDSTNGYYTCNSNGDRECSDGYTGLPDCLDNICSPACVNGDCIGPNTCSCSTGWTGTACDVCILDPNCPADRATCTVPGECECNQGYSGTLCQNDDDVCGHTSPCANGATCNNAGSNDYTCTCPPGYTGDTCSEEVDACVVNSEASLPCQNEGTCMATGPGTFSCTCETGWTGDTCDTNVNECSPTPPCVQGSCTDCTPTGPIVSDPTNPNFVFCPNGYICECPAGFFGNDCEADVDACESMPCQNEGMCVDVVGGPGYTCVCPSGYTGSDCETDVDECASTSDLCHNGGTCTNSEGYYNCSCPIGFQGTNCEIDIDECLTANCVENTTLSCSDGPGNFTCHCRSGYMGTLCDEQVDLCNPHPCNNGNCTSSFNDFSCTCFVGFTGVECDRDIDYCTSPDVCLNGGTCVDGLMTYTCECPSLLTGQQCETSFNPCESFPCGGGQGCVIEGNSFICEDCDVLAESSTTPDGGCTPSIIDPGSVIGGNNTTPDSGTVIGGVIGGLVGAILFLLLVIAVIICCVKFCVCCLPVKETETESEYQTLPRNATQHNPLYFGTSTLLSNSSGTLRSAYGTTTRVESPTHRNDPTYEKLGNSSSSNEDNLSPLQNPMYALSQVTLEKSGGYQAPNVPPRNSNGVYLTDNVSYLPAPSNTPSNGHYETIPALQNGQQPVFVTSGKYDSLIEKTPAKESSFMKSGKYDSLASAPPINKHKSAKRESLASTAEVPPAGENPYVLSPSREAAPELTMEPSARGDDYAMLPPMTAFASLKKEAKSDKTAPQKTGSEHEMPTAKESPYEFS